MDFYTRFSAPPSEARVFTQPSRTRQEFKRECDINYILARVGAGLDTLVPPEATYEDISEIPSNYEEIMAKLIDADERFAMLPSSLRERFGNNPSQLLAFLNDASNREEAVKLGLLQSPAERPASSVSVAADDKQRELMPNE